MKQKLICFLLLALIAVAPLSVLHGQIISTVAGNGTYGYSGDGGQATAASLTGPNGIAFDGAGNMYIAGGGNNVIRKVTPAGIISTIAGTGIAGFFGDGGYATSARLYNPSGIAVDASGNIYFSDCYNYRIRKINTSGIISTIAGNGSFSLSGDGGPATAAGMIFPKYLAIDGPGNLYLTDSNGTTVRKISTAGIITTVAGSGTYGYSGDGGPATAAALADASGLAVDGSGNLFIADAGNYVNCLSALGEWFFRGYYVVERHWSCYHCLLNHPIE